ncbi:hypothetical protein GCM10010520_23560 [Rhizobium viscosum]|uniref:THIF-type NAD/FAD binding fold domain-containing protein n=1 Tax=Rhizobium viscosum TaxID=1673 RepID=A0ABR9IIW5_RHIVS|nr:ThiF family adenylyltransferase [Rhizobium viscosum]MBE1503128.1 hypothetical protein [Rhizobium viscosum]
MIWWLENRQRARAEKAALVALHEDNDWFTGMRVKFDDLQFCADVALDYGGELFHFALLYPSTFPDSPPMVIPYGDRLISGHQYGPGGELCLQWRPDNWDPSVTGAMMIESAYNLIKEERPSNGGFGEVQSVHQMSLGAELRFSSWRLMAPGDAWTSLDGQLPELVANISLMQTAKRHSRVLHLKSIGGAGNEFWKSTRPLPTHAVERTGFLIRTGQDMSVVAQHPGGALGDLSKRIPELAEFLNTREPIFLVLIEGNGRRTAFDVLCEKGEPYLIPYRIVDEADLARRSASDREVVSQSRIAIVGCGSIGSKVAASLARGGARKFLLVDEDIFLPSNLVRNELDARAIGWHKVEALADRIEQIVADADVIVRRVALGSQTSAALMEATLELIGECELIVDATANPTSFNLCAGAARRNRRPMVWAEVFGGGIGGIIARARPDSDPHPLAARKQITTWCEDQNKPWEFRVADSYDANRDDGPPFIADDADVSVIAAHASRFAIDILQGGETSFPYSGYAIGLKKAWIFEAPFDTWPIELRITDPWELPAEGSSDEEISSFISDLMNEGRT